MNSNKCPQCEKEINDLANRVIQDSCGHKKCRICLMQDEINCKTCEEINNLRNASNNNNTTCNISVIKYDIKSQPHISTQLDCSSEKIKTKATANEITTQKDCSNLTEKTEKCDNKKKLIRRPVAIPTHITVITKVPLLYKCTICLKTFSTSASVKYHMYCSGIEKPLKCDLCNKGFISRSHLETHKLKHSGNRPFVCTLCQKSFTQKSKLNRHMKLHTGDKPFVCSECGKKFTNKDAMNGHYRTHTGAKPYSCKQCGNRFNNKSNLSKHLVTHSKDKLYMCEECGKKFSNKWALISHRKCHSRERPYSCQKCSRTFTNIKDLKRHGIIHLDVKPYGCKICNTKFCRKDNLERHLKNTHSMKTQSEIKSATIKYGVNKKMIDSITTKIVKEPESSKTKPPESEANESTIQDNPNAIHVIKTSNETNSTTQNNIIRSVRNTVPVINGPFKLAFKTDAFRNNYNILNKNYTEPAPRIQTKKPYDMVESLNICQKILSPMNTTNIKNNIDTTKISPIDKPKNVIMSVGKVNEKDSLEICKKILTPIDVLPLHYGTSFESKKHAVIKNIKFKLPSTYTDNVMKSSENIFEPEKLSNFSQETLESVSPVCHVNQEINFSANEYTELQPMKPYSEEIISNCVNKQSVIVNPHSNDILHVSKTTVPFNEMHWRRRTSQILQPKIHNS